MSFSWLLDAWWCSCMLIVLQHFTEASGWLISGAWPRQIDTRRPFPTTRTNSPNGTGRSPSFACVVSDSSNDGEEKDSGAAATEQHNQGQATPTLDSDAPVFYIKGLKGGIGAGARGDDAGEGRSRVDSEGSAVGTTDDGTPSVWENIQQSLGLGTWSYVGLGLALVMITLNNVLGLGWLSRAINPDSDAEGIINVESQQPQVQIMRLDDPSNLLPP